MLRTNEKQVVKISNGRETAEKGAEECFVNEKPELKKNNRLDYHCKQYAAPAKKWRGNRLHCVKHFVILVSSVGSLYSIKHHFAVI